MTAPVFHCFLVCSEQALSSYMELQSPVSSLNPPAILLLTHSAPVTSYSSNIPGLLPPQGPCSCCPFFPECSVPRNLH